MTIEMGISLGKAIVVLLVVWLLVIVLMTGPLYHTSSDTTAKDRIAESLARTSEQVELLKKQNEEFRSRLADLRLIESNNNNAVPCADRIYLKLQAEIEQLKQQLHRTEETSSKTVCEQTTAERAVLRRRVERGVREMWFFVRGQLKKLHSLSKKEPVQKRINEIIEDAAEHKRTILIDLHNLSRVNNEWSSKELRDLNSLVQNRIHNLQNPTDCKSAKKVVCNLNKGCGYGCQLHHVVYCFIVAYGMQRTMVLRSQGWRYNRQGWEAMFQPVSDTCNDDVTGSVTPWPGSADAAAIQLPIVDALHPRPDYLPLAVPRDLLPRLNKVHGDPSVWWVSQFVRYLLRPQDHLANFLSKMEAKVPFGHGGPIVGVHVRRTDKVGTEAAYHGLEEYMEHVEDFFRTVALSSSSSNVARRVYLASDDAGVLDEARNKYPEYTFYGDANIAKSASVGSRYSDDSLLGVVADIHLLSKCDYLVCTFSSQVCRVAYEIMQTTNEGVDASSAFYSLDDIYYFGGQSAHNQKALQAHRPRDGEIAFEPGDIIGIAGNHWDGYSKGVNRRTLQEGLYPSFKAEDLIAAADFPTYNAGDDDSRKTAAPQQT